MFLHNLLPTLSSLESTLVSLHPIKSSSSAPHFPTAHSVTVARIASPHSVHRAYQPLFLDALKDYFQGRRRVLKKGDLIAVGVCEDVARYSTGGKEDSKVEDDDVE